MNSLQIFNHSQFGEIRMIELNNKPYAVANDVLKSLGYAEGSWRTTLSRKCKGVTKCNGLKVNGIELNLIPEGDIYRLITGSHLEVAEKFESWVFDEVLPSIRRNGAYMTDDVIKKALTSPDFLIQLATNLKEEKEKRILAEQKIEEQKPKVLFADAVSVAHTSILVGDLAKLIKQNGVDIGANRLFQWLRKEGYLIKRKGTDYNMPTQKSMDLGLFEVKETSITHSDGHISISKTPKVTGKGQLYFVNKFISNLTKQEIACTE